MYSSYVAKMQNPMKQNLLFHMKVVDLEKSGQAATGVPNEWWVPPNDGWHDEQWKKSLQILGHEKDVCDR